MKQKRLNLIRRFIFLILGVLIAIGFSVVNSCKKKSNPSLNNVTVSGIFRGDTVWIDGSIPARITFSFDERSDGTLSNGGVWLLIMGKKYPYSRYKYKARHTIGRWEETSDGYTVVEGVCDFGKDMGPIAFSGILNKNEIFQYTVVSEKFQAKGTAIWKGKYVRPWNSPGLKNTMDTNYLGTYTVSLGGTTQEDCYNPPSNWNVDPCTISVNITGQYPDSIGGIMLAGQINGYIPYINQSVTDLETDDQGSEVSGGYLFLITMPAGVGNTLMLYCNSCIWNPEYSYSCDNGYYLTWYYLPQNATNYCEIIFSGSVNMSPRLKKQND